MIYNFVKYLKTEFPSEVIYTNLRVTLSSQSVIPDRCLLIRETGGDEQAWTRYIKKTIQIIARDLDLPKTRDLAYDVYNKMTSRYGLLLPSVTVDNVNYPEIQMAEITAIQEPYCMGYDETGRVEYSNNYMIIYQR